MDGIGALDLGRDPSVRNLKNFISMYNAPKMSGHGGGKTLATAAPHYDIGHDDACNRQYHDDGDF